MKLTRGCCANGRPSAPAALTAAASRQPSACSASAACAHPSRSAAVACSVSQPFYSHTLSRTSSSRHSRSRTRAPTATAAPAPIADEDELAADNFYQILGVSPGASRRDIKQAYKALMKDVHPDLSGDDESTEFCILLNDIYETLLDPERRAVYDALAGFSMSSINPFADTSLPADQVFVDEYTCIGCRNCTNVCPKSFAMEEDYGRARVMQQGVDSDEKLQEAIDTCPVNCIHWVTASQLSLLEAAMAKMDRVAVWSLMSGGGSGVNVFNEASIAWEKRQAEVRAKVQLESDQAAIWAAWWENVGGGSAGANMYAQAAQAARRASSASASGSYDSDDASSTGSFDDGEEYGGGGGGAGREFNGTKEGARIAKLAAKAARAARQWKSWQEEQRRSRSGGLLIASVSGASGEQE